MLENDTLAEQPTIPTAKPQPVTFTAEQQAKIDQIVKDSMSRAGRDARAQLDIERKERAEEKQRATQLESDLQAARDALASSANNTERDELKQQIQTISQELESEKQSRRDSENREINYRRSALIAQACLDHDLIDAEIVTGLVENNIVWNPERQSFDVRDDQDVPEEMSLAEFFSNFATKRPYLVRSSIKTGSGSSDSSRSGLPTGRQQHKVEDIFGRGSNSQLANQLAQTDKGEYRRLKAEAKAKGLI